jgi:hypothetical protein
MPGRDNRKVRPHWLDDFVAGLEAEGFVSHITEEDRATLLRFCRKFFGARGLCEPHRGGRTHLTRQRWREIVDEYLRRKKRGCSYEETSAIAASLGVSKERIWYWAREFYGKGALRVTDRDWGRCKPAILRAVESAGGRPAMDIATELGMPPGTVWRNLRALEKEGRVRREKLRHRSEGNPWVAVWWANAG